MNEILKAQDVYKAYKMGQARIEVLSGLDLTVREGEFLAVVGASGSGKSTLLHILGALDRPDKGSVEYEGKDLNRFSGGRLNRYRNRNIGFIFQFYHLLDELDVLENALLPVMASGGPAYWLGQRKKAQEQAKTLLTRLGLAHRLHHRPYQLSGGERQRVAIARSLINRPPVLLADEPTGNLDSETGNGILEALDEFHRDGQTIVMVTHDDRIAQRADRTIRLVDGRIES